MDALDNAITEKAAEVEQLRERILVLEAELSALRLAAELRPSTTFKRGGKTNHRGGGRRPGDISMDWRAILARVYASQRAVGYEEITRVASDLGNELAASSVRDRVRNLVKTELMDGDAKTGFTVTDYAAKRFGFAPGNEATAEASEANTGGATNAPGVLDLQTQPDEAHEKGASLVASRFET